MENTIVHTHTCEHGNTLELAQYFSICLSELGHENELVKLVDGTGHRVWSNGKAVDFILPLSTEERIRQHNRDVLDRLEKIMGHVIR